MPDAPHRIQRSRVRFWTMPTGAVYVGRPSRWGNPFDFRLLGRDLAVRMFDDLVRGFFNPSTLSHLADEQFRVVYDAKERWRRRLGYGVEIQRGARLELRGRDLVCWCPLTLPDGSRCPCHADVLLESANA